MKNNITLNNFGQRLKQLRTKHGFSQEDLANQANLDRSYVGGVERGERNISLLNIEKILKPLNVSISEFFKDFND